MFVIATYHHVTDSIPSGAHSKLWVSPESFRAQLESVATQVISLDEALNGGNGVVITVDDGYASFQRHALPILVDLKLPATLFVSTGKVGSSTFEPEYNAQIAYSSWAELDATTAIGIDVQLHGHDHQHLSAMSERALAIELETALGLFIQGTGRKPRHFCYPYGDYDQKCLTLLKKFGLVSACTCELGLNDRHTDPLRLRRFAAEISWSGDEMRGRVQSLMRGDKCVT